MTPYKARVGVLLKLMLVVEFARRSRIVFGGLKGKWVSRECTALAKYLNFLLKQPTLPTAWLPASFGLLRSGVESSASQRLVWATVMIFTLFGSQNSFRLILKAQAVSTPVRYDGFTTTTSMSSVSPYHDNHDNFILSSQAQSKPARYSLRGCRGGWYRWYTFQSPKDTILPRGPWRPLPDIQSQLPLRTRPSHCLATSALLPDNWTRILQTRLFEPIRCCFLDCCLRMAPVDSLRHLGVWRLLLSTALYISRKEHGRGRIRKIDCKSGCCRAATYLWCSPNNYDRYWSLRNALRESRCSPLLFEMETTSESNNIHHLACLTGDWTSYHICWYGIERYAQIWQSWDALSTTW